MYTTTCDKCKRSIEDAKEYVHIRYTNQSDWKLGRDGHFCKSCGRFLIAYIKKQKWWEREKSVFEKELEKKTGKVLKIKSKK